MKTNNHDFKTTKIIEIFLIMKHDKTYLQNFLYFLLECEWKLQLFDKYGF